MLQNMLLTDPSLAAEELQIPHLAHFGRQLQGMVNEHGKLDKEGQKVASTIIVPIMRSLGGGHGPAALADLGFRFANPGGEQAMAGLDYVHPATEQIHQTQASMLGEHADPMRQEEGQQRALERAAAEFRVPDNVKGQFIDQIQMLMEQGKSRTDALDEVVADMKRDRLIPIAEKHYGRFSEGESQAPIPSKEHYHEMAERIGQELEDEPEEAGYYDRPTSEYMWDIQHEAQATEGKRGAKAARSKREAFGEAVGEAERKKIEEEELQEELHPPPSEQTEALEEEDKKRQAEKEAEEAEEAEEAKQLRQTKIEQAAMAPDVQVPDKTVGEMRAEGTLPQEESEVDIGRQASGLSDEEHARFFGKSLGSELLESILGGMWR